MSKLLLTQVIENSSSVNDHREKCRKDHGIKSLIAEKLSIQSLVVELIEMKISTSYSRQHRLGFLRAQLIILREA